MLLDKDAAIYLAREMGIDPAFIEKDWHAVRVLEALSQYSHDRVTSIFTGGTSLSIGNGLLKRFSEDLDFRAQFAGDINGNQLKKLKSAFRTGIIDTLSRIDEFSFDPNNIKSNGLGFKIQLAYPRVFEAPHALRPEIQIEFSYTQPRLAAQLRPIGTMISRYK